ncbi:MAG: thioredoxin family protein [Egibacteraceae bacterium]
MPGNIAEATKDTFRDLVDAPLVLVDVWGPSCQQCLALMPAVERLASSHPELVVVKLEAPKARRLCIELKVMGLPAFLLFSNGQEVARLAAPDLDAARLEDWLDENLNLDGLPEGGE